VGLWNFNDGTAKDSSTNNHHGKLVGNARVVAARRTTSSQLSMPVIFFGKVTDGAGNAVTNATISVWDQDNFVSSATPDTKGNYSIALRAEHDTIDISASAGDLGAWAMGVNCSAGQRKEVNLTLFNAVSIAGKVTAFDKYTGPLTPAAV
jgi:hypothetical protein